MTTPIKHFKSEHYVLALIALMVVTFTMIVGYGFQTNVIPVHFP